MMPDTPTALPVVPSTSPPTAPAAPYALVIGESIVDIAPDEDGVTREFAGGSPMNVAVGLARLGRPTTLATWYGNDARGRLIAQHLSESGVTPLPGSDKARRTPTAQVFFDSNRSATYEFDLDWQMPALHIDALPLVVHTGSIGATLGTGAADALEAVRSLARSATITYDPNTRPHIIGEPDANRAQIEACVRASDIVKASAEDVAWLYGTKDGIEERWLGDGSGIRLGDSTGDEPKSLSGASLNGVGPLLLVVTDGGAGVTAWTRSGLCVTLPSLPVKVADTVGAGDSFMSALIHALWEAGLLGAANREKLASIDSDVLTEVLNFCMRVGAITVSRASANPPWLSEL